METEFIYERLRTPAGVKLEVITGGDGRTGRVWELMARQVYAENGRDGYRAITHTPAGTPLLEDENTRISVAHTSGLFCVGTLPPTPETDLSTFSPRSALGVDAERADREQVLRVREKFLSEDEASEIPADDLTANLLAWTAKEAVLKLSQDPALPYRTAINIIRLPQPNGKPGQASLRFNDKNYAVNLHAMRYGPHIITLAITPETATYRKDR